MPASQSYERLEQRVLEMFGKHFILPVHQGRAAENIISQAFITPGTHIPMNYHFTTTKAHIELNGGTLHEIYTDEALKVKSDHPFKGNMDTAKLEALIEEVGVEAIPFIRLEASTNLIGGQPFSMENMRQVRAIADKAGIMLVLDASLIGENAWFIKQRESGYSSRSMQAIIHEMSELSDLVYFSARKLSSSRGVGRDPRRSDDQPVPRFYRLLRQESRRDGAAGRYSRRCPRGSHRCRQLSVSPPANRISGRRPGIGLLSYLSVRRADGSDLPADIELMRLAFPRRVFTLSQVEYVIDRLAWLYDNRELVGGLQWDKEPEVLRFFVGRLKPIGDWPEKLMARFRADFGDSL